MSWQQTQNLQQTPGEEKIEDVKESDLLGARGEEEPGVLLLPLPLSLPRGPLPGLQAQPFTLDPQPEFGSLTAGWLVAGFLKYFQLSSW